MQLPQEREGAVGVLRGGVAAGRIAWRRGCQQRDGRVERAGEVERRHGHQSSGSGRGGRAARGLRLLPLLLLLHSALLL